MEKIVGMFYEQELQGRNQRESWIEKVIKLSNRKQSI